MIWWCWIGTTWWKKCGNWDGTDLMGDAKVAVLKGRQQKRWFGTTWWDRFATTHKKEKHGNDKMAKKHAVMLQVVAEKNSWVVKVGKMSLIFSGGENGPLMTILKLSTQKVRWWMEDIPCWQDSLKSSTDRCVRISCPDCEDLSSMWWVVKMKIWVMLSPILCHVCQVLCHTICPSFTNFVPAFAWTLGGDYGKLVKSWSVSILTKPFPCRSVHTVMVRQSSSGSWPVRISCPDCNLSLML